MRRGGWPHDITGRDWRELLTRYREVPPHARPVADIIASVVDSGVDAELGYETSLWDLIVTPLPVVAPPLDVVIVRGSYTKARPGHVMVDHLPLVGLSDSIERDESEAVPLFWRFMREKYGLVANR